MVSARARPPLPRRWLLLPLLKQWNLSASLPPSLLLPALPPSLLVFATTCIEEIGSGDGREGGVEQEEVEGRERERR